ncbi:MAG: branched-chain amino acid ABC transporter permease [Acetobacteraceae bacterium]|nr:branched-chain amino acid ABC transporter permease [Acetobacteraceae bacterium]
MVEGRIRRAATALFITALVLLPVATSLLGINWVLDLATRMIILALAATALNIVLGYGGMVSFGHAAYFGAGAYVVGILAHHEATYSRLLDWPIALSGTSEAWIAWPAAMLVAGLLALAIGAICLRTGGLYFIMITLAFAQMIYYLFVSLPDYGGEDGLSLMARSRLGPLKLKDEPSFYAVCLALLFLVLAFKRVLVRSRLGWVLMGVRDNERRMRALGFPVYRYKLAAFALSGAIAGLAGALMANLTEYVSPAQLSWTLSGELLVIVVLGGLGTLFGPLIGAIALLAVEFALRETVPHWPMVLGLLIVLVAVLSPRGLAGFVPRRGIMRGEGGRDG